MAKRSKPLSRYGLKALIGILRDIPGWDREEREGLVAELLETFRLAQLAQRIAKRGRN